MNEQKGARAAATTVRLASNNKGNFLHKESENSQKKIQKERHPMKIMKIIDMWRGSVYKRQICGKMEVIF